MPRKKEPEYKKEIKKVWDKTEKVLFAAVKLAEKHGKNEAKKLYKKENQEEIEQARIDAKIEVLQEMEKFFEITEDQDYYQDWLEFKENQLK